MKKKMQKITAFAMVMILVLSLFIGDIAAWASYDVTAPMINSIEFLDSTAEKGESIQARLDIVEEETGVDYIYFRFGLKDSSSSDRIYYQYIVEESFYSGELVIDIPIDEECEAGVRYISAIYIYDNAGNVTRYNGDDEYSQDESGLCLWVSGADVTCSIIGSGYFEVLSDGDNIAPIITGIRNMPSTLSVGSNTVSFVIDTTEKAEDIKEIEFLFYTFKNKKRYQGTGYGRVQNGENGLLCTAELFFDASGVYHIAKMRIEDMAGNSRQYSSFDVNNEMKYEEDEEGVYLLNEEEGHKCYLEGDGLITIPSTGDEINPIIKSIEVKEQEVEKPGVLHIEMDIWDDTEVDNVWIKLEDKERKDEIAGSIWFRTTSVKEGTVQTEFAISTKTMAADYEITVLSITDKAGNETNYCMDGSEGKYYSDQEGFYMIDMDDSTNQCRINGTGIVSIKEEFEVAFEVGISHANLVQKIQAMEEGETGRIYIDRTKIAKKELFEAIKGIDKTLMFYNDNYQWIFNGKDIHTPKNIDLSISFSKIWASQYDNTGEVLQIIFPENGELPGKANIRIKSDYTYEIYGLEHAMYLYYVDHKGGQLDIQLDSDIDYLLDGTDHWCKFDITHNSEYVVSGEKLSDTTFDVYFNYKKHQYRVISFKKKTVEYIEPTNKKASSVTIPSTVKYDGKTYKVTTINENAFYGNKYLKKLKIGSSVTKIERSAFNNCKKLSSVSLPSGLKTIESRAFYKCTSLKKVTIPSKVTTIGERAFYGCKKLKAITIKTTKLTSKKFGRKVFSGIYKKATIKVPKSRWKKYRRIFLDSGFYYKIKMKK